MHIFGGSRDGTVVRALTSHQCGPGSIPALGVICGLSLLLVLVLARRGFSPSTLVFPDLLKNQHFQMPIRSGVLRATGLSVVTDCKVSPLLNKVDLFIYLFIYLFMHVYVPCCCGCFVLAMVGKPSSRCMQW